MSQSKKTSTCRSKYATSIGTCSAHSSETSLVLSRMHRMHTKRWEWPLLWVLLWNGESAYLPTHTCDSGIILPPSLRFVIASWGRQCFPAGTWFDRGFQIIQVVGIVAIAALSIENGGLECCPEPAGCTPTCFSNITRCSSGTACELCSSGRSSFSFIRPSNLSLWRVSVRVCCSTFTFWLHSHSIFRPSRIHGDCDRKSNEPRTNRHYLS